MKQFFTVLLILIIVIAAYSQKELMINIIESGEAIAFFISILFVAVLVLFPVIPYAVLAGLLGSIFGVWLGTVISLLGITIGTLAMFKMARYGFQNWAQKTLQKYSKVKEFESYFEKNAFLGILLVRLIPVVPSPVVNILCGICMIPWYIFLSASLLGKLPAVIIFTFAGSVFEHNKILAFSIYAIYFIIITCFTSIHMHKRQKFRANL
jgi:uncharacterized membrane protein YdjX (TVP38/TMEM64 family)